MNLLPGLQDAELWSSEDFVLPSGHRFSADTASLCRDTYRLSLLVHVEECSTRGTQEHNMYVAHHKLLNDMRVDAMRAVAETLTNDTDVAVVANTMVGPDSYRAPSSFAGSMVVCAALQLGYLVDLTHNMIRRGLSVEAAWAVMALMSHPARYGANVFHANEPLASPYPRPE